MRHRVVGEVAVGILWWTGLLLGQDAPSINTEGCALSGRILNGGTNEPIRGATVKLTDASQSTRDLISSLDSPFSNKSKAGSSDLKAESLTDGTFCFHAVNRGQYALSASKPGFIDSYYGATSSSQLGSVLQVGDKGIDGVAVKLEPTSGIVGRIVDSYGEAVEEANVVAVKESWYQGRQVFMPVQGVLSDERGGYRIGKLTAGTYFVYAQPGHFSPTAGSSPQMVRTYYFSGLSLSEGAGVNVPPGDDARGIDVRLIKTNTYHVRGKLQGTRDQWAGGSVRLLPRQEEPTVLVISGASNLSPEGSFDFPNVSPGSYKLTFRSAAGASQRDVEVRSSDISVDIPISSNAALRGTVVFDGVSVLGSAAMPKITLKPADALVGPTYEVNIDSGGRMFKADGISPGKYFLSIAVPAGEFVKSIKAGSSELGSRQLDLTAGGTVDLAILVKSGSATVGGALVEAAQANNTAVPLARIVAIAFPPKVADSGLYFGVTDSTGHFAINNVAPGTYRVCALQSFDVELFQNPSLLKNIADKGTEVELQENENKSIELSLISSEMLQQLLAGSTAGN